MGSVHEIPKPDIKIVKSEFGVGRGGTDVIEFCGASRDSVDPCYRKISEFIKEYELEALYIEDYDYKEAPFPPSDNEFLRLAQARAGGLNATKRENYTLRFDKGETLDYPPIMIQMGTYLMPGVGNHRAFGKHTSKKSKGKAVIILQGSNTDEVQRNIILKIASMGNTETKQDKDVDTMEDISQQVFNAWGEIVNADIDSEHPVLQEERRQKGQYTKLNTEEKKEEFKLAWFTDWMKENKPISFPSKGKQTQIYNSAFSSEHGQPINEYSQAELKDMFEEIFTGYDWNPEEWSMKAPHKKNIHQIKGQWLTFGRNIFRELAEPIHSGTCSLERVSVHLVLAGSPSWTALATRKTEMKKMIKKIAEWNTNERTINWKLPQIEKIVMPKALRGCGDETYAYEWNEQKKRFDKKIKGE